VVRLWAARASMICRGETFPRLTLLTELARVCCV